MTSTSALRRGNDPASPFPKSNKGYKWNNIIKPIYDKHLDRRRLEKEQAQIVAQAQRMAREEARTQKKEAETRRRAEARAKEKRSSSTQTMRVEGEAVHLSSDPKALIKRLRLLLASWEAGNTGVRNEIVSIGDELRRMNAINVNQYKNIMSHI